MLLLIFLSTFVLAIGLTILFRNVALRFDITDKPDKARKIHRKAVPLLGGGVIFLAFFLVLFFVHSDALAGGLTVTQLMSFFIAGAVLLVGGILDDIFELKSWQHILFTLVAVGIAVFGGIQIEKVSNPLADVGSLLFFGSIASMVITFIWLLGMTYTTKLLDGVDGLVTGLGAISGFIIFLFTMTTKYYQPDIGLIALIFSAVCLGFLVLNFYPAKIFLGDSGSMLIGFIIGVLAIISGGKIAVALLIMGIPIFDVVWTISRRLLAGKNPFVAADSKHLHHRFLDLGLSQRQTVLVYYVLAITFGLTTLFLQSKGKLIAIGVLAVIMVIIAFTFVFLDKSIKKV